MAKSGKSRRFDAASLGGGGGLRCGDLTWNSEAACRRSASTIDALRERETLITSGRHVDSGGTGVGGTLTATLPAVSVENYNYQQFSND